MHNASSCLIRRQTFPGSLMKDGIPKNSCLVREEEGKKKLLYSHPRLSLGLVRYRSFTRSRYVRKMAS